MEKQESGDVEEQLAAIDARTEQRRLERKKEEQRQEVTDLEAKERLIDEHGEDAIAAVKVPKFSPGYPTRAFVVRPAAEVYKRYQDSLSKAQGSNNHKAIREAHELFARACWIYPETKEERVRMHERFPGILNAIGNQAAKLAEGTADEEGKG